MSVCFRCDEKVQSPDWSGGLGDVWKAVDEQGRDVVVKKTRHALMAGAPDDFVREVVAYRNMPKHPNVCELLDVAWTCPPSLTIAFVGEHNLEDVLADYRIPRHYDAWYTQLMAAITHLHTHGIVHRDIKPGNIFLSPTEDVVLGDMGAVGFVQSLDSHMTMLEVTTYPYAAPEYIRCEKYGPPVDVWAVGLVIAELLTNRRWFNGEKLRVVRRKQVERLDAYLDLLPKRWKELRACLSMRPEKRPKTTVGVFHLYREMFKYPLDDVELERLADKYGYARDTYALACYLKRSNRDHSDHVLLSIASKIADDYALEDVDMNMTTDGRIMLERDAFTTHESSLISAH